MFNCKQFRELIIKPSLADIGLYSQDAEELLVFTCATESIGGTYLAQVRGPALSVFQIEPATYNDIWQNYLMRHERTLLLSRISRELGITAMPDPSRMIWDLRFATVMARIFYLRKPQALPKHTDIDGIWEYYKRHYNTSLGKATKNESISKYRAFIK